MESEEWDGKAGMVWKGRNGMGWKGRNGMGWKGRNGMERKENMERIDYLKMKYLYGKEEVDEMEKNMEGRSMIAGKVEGKEVTSE